MAHKGKRYEDAAKRYDRAQLHAPSEAIDLAKNLAKSNFDETVEAAFRLGVDPRKADQIVRGTVGLPAGTGRDVRVAVFAGGERAAEAREAGAEGGRVEYRTDRYGNIHVPIGKVSFGADKLLSNFQAVVDELNRAKPAAAKGRYMRKVVLSTTHGPGVKVDPSRVVSEAH
jgi:large subunit ribosomal protein L1